MIQPNQQSVIQTPANIQPMGLPKSVLLVSKPNSVIHTTQGTLQAVQVSCKTSNQIVNVYKILMMVFLSDHHFHCRLNKSKICRQV